MLAKVDGIVQVRKNGKERNVWFETKNVPGGFWFLLWSPNFPRSGFEGLANLPPGKYYAKFTIEVDEEE